MSRILLTFYVTLQELCWDPVRPEISRFLPHISAQQFCSARKYPGSRHVGRASSQLACEQLHFSHVYFFENTPAIPATPTLCSICLASVV